MHFAWPVPGRAKVTHRAERDGHVSTMRYDLAVKRNAEGQLEVRFDGFTFTELDGKDMQASELRAVRAGLEKLTAMIPNLLITPEGDYAGVLGMDEMIEALLAFERKTKTPAQMASMERLLRSPEVKAMLIAKSGDYWHTWVGVWKDLRLTPGERWTAALEVGTPSGTVEVPAVFEHHGAVPGEPGLVRFSMASTLEGEAAASLMAGILREVIGALGKSTMPKLESVRRATKASADIDPRTAKPRRARMEVLMEVKIEGIPAKSQRQVDEYEFAWP
jgi:hypothetical protein